MDFLFTCWLFIYRLEKFLIYYHHGGRFINIEEVVVYVGGFMLSKHRLDAYRIGYLDLINDIE